ncbi:MAG TPA: A/G-specific adenine glycosylase [Saprospiraceae bacterium]|nr:A/G-specific adenine glycosylase [Saprospiraceae bacterium]
MTNLENGNELFVRSLFSWYLKHKRPLPWRKTKDPYKIWVSEIILQQTRIDQGMDYYIAFINKWPDVASLARATEDELMKAWEGLGYYNRARNMHQTAKYVSNELNAQFPKTYKDLLRLKGIGPYTAAAIASFAYGLPHPVVDGNVYRVIARIKNLEMDITKPSARSIFVGILEKMMDGVDPAVFNNAIMEFGALQCTPRNPLCEDCFYSEHCQAYQKNTVQVRPVKTKKTKKRTRYLHYFVQDKQNEQWVRKRGPGDIWPGLYEFPLRETTTKPKNISEILPAAALPKNQAQLLFSKKHILTHQVLHIHLWLTELDTRQLENEGFRQKSQEELNQLSFPRPLHGIFEKL